MILYTWRSRLSLSLTSLNILKSLTDFPTFLLVTPVYFLIEYLLLIAVAELPLDI